MNGFLVGSISWAGIIVLLGCGSVDGGFGESGDGSVGKQPTPLEFRATQYDYGDNQCVFNGLSMHCCPGNAPGQTRWVMVGAHLDLDVFKCAELDPPTYAPPFVDTGTVRDNMHACPPDSVMVGFHLQANQLACIPLERAMQEWPDNGTQDDFQMHVCPAGRAMSGIHAVENRFLCAE
jgi:hypothetical protein